MSQLVLVVPVEGEPYAYPDGLSESDVCRIGRWSAQRREQAIAALDAAIAEAERACDGMRSAA